MHRDQPQAEPGENPAPGEEKENTEGGQLERRPDNVGQSRATGRRRANIPPSKARMAQAASITPGGTSNRHANTGCIRLVTVDDWAGVAAVGKRAAAGHPSCAPIKLLLHIPSHP
jgi:hypothetical protein